MGIVAGALTGSVNTDFPKLSLGKVENITLILANTEYTHVFPANTKTFLMQARDGAGKIKLAFDVGTSGSVYHTVPAGGFYSSGFIVAPTITVYIQSPSAGIIVELTSWS